MVRRKVDALFSQTTEYAVRAVVWLAENNGDGLVGAQTIAAGTQVPPSFLPKILQELCKAGLVSSRVGASGGFELCYGPEELTVLDVVNAVAPIQRYTGCPLGLKKHRKMRCSMHASLDEALENVEKVLSGTTIADILSDKTRPRPMVDA